MPRPATDLGDNRRPLYQRTAEALAEVVAATPEGGLLPSEPALARSLGVSRATLREAMRAFEERGLVVRRQGVGTFVRRRPPVIESGLEVLESIETLAARKGLSVRMGARTVTRRPSTGDEAQRFGIAEGAELLEVSRVIAAAGRPVAFLVDTLPMDVLPEGDLQGNFRGSVLDLLLRRGDPPLGVSRTEITAASAAPEIARHLSIQRGDVLLRFEASLYGRDGRVIDHSLSYFLPGVFRFHVLRRIGHPAEAGGSARQGDDAPHPPRRRTRLDKE
jgi:GntR family transcriptional regulator